MYTDLGLVSSLAVAANQLYWTQGVGNSSVLVRAPKEGGCPEVMISDLVPAGSVRELLNDSDALYVSTMVPARQLLRVDKISTQVSVLVDGSSCSAPLPLIAQNDTRLFFGCATGGGFVGRVEKSSSPMPVVHYQPGAGELGATGLAASANWVFWVSKSLFRVDATTAAGPQTVSTAADLERVAVGLSAVYSQRASQVWSTTPDGSNPALFIPNLSDVSHLTAQSGIVVVSDGKGTTGSQRVVGRGEQQPTHRVYTSSEGRVSAIAADARYVYWTDTQTGAIRRRAR